METTTILFDGVCNLCNGFVNFVIDRDPERRFRFASLQSGAGQALMATHGLTPVAGDPASIIVIANGRALQRSSAVLRIASGLAGPWRLMAAFRIVPPPLRDVVYSFVAGHRYAWFGRSNECRLPTPELRERFL